MSKMDCNKERTAVDTSVRNVVFKGCSDITEQLLLEQNRLEHWPWSSLICNVHQALVLGSLHHNFLSHTSAVHHLIAQQTFC